MVAVPIATGRTPAELRALARRERDARVSSRLLALANASDGMSRDEAARAAGMARPTLRDWVHRYDAEGVEGLRDRPRPGRPCALDEGRQAALKGLILRGPKLERDGCVAWRARDLRGLAERRFGVRYSESGVSGTASFQARAPLDRGVYGSETRGTRRVDHVLPAAPPPLDLLHPAAPHPPRDREARVPTAARPGADHPLARHHEPPPP